MIHWRRATVRTVLSDRSGVREVTAALTEPLPGREETAEDGAGEVRALAYTDLVGVPEPGDAVLLNVSALARGLGTGGFALVAALPERLPADPPPGPGHLVKDRYSPLQTMVLGVDDQESAHHETLKSASSLGGVPVVVADLHSAVPAIAAGILADRPQARIAYVMTDGAALPLQFSQAVQVLQEAGVIASTVTVGQAHGGDHEAVTVHTGLLAAVHVAGADAVIVAQGPGNLGTGTPYGFSGLVVGDHLNAVRLLGGTPLAALRMSQADGRERHLGISHHTLTAVGEVARPGAVVPVPRLDTLTGAEAARARDWGQEQAWTAPEAVLPARMEEQAAQLTAAGHVREDVDLAGLLNALEASPARMSTMGRGLDRDLVAFLAAAAAGRAAAARI